MSTHTPAGSSAGYVASLRDLTRSDAMRCGTKAANLGELAGDGFVVPDGFVLTTSAFQRFLSSNGLSPTSSPAAAAEASLPPDLAEALFAAADSLGDCPLAVRSSGIAEDLSDVSFAGQYESVMNVRGRDALVAAVRRCWNSGFSERVAAYQTAHGLESAGMAVLIQCMVPATAAGVAFTANPVSGDRAETHVNAVRGLGERLVLGHASADEWVVSGGEAVCRRASEDAITVDQARAVARMARQVEAHFDGAPQDVEWALDGEELFLLQARPITALPEPVEWKALLPGAWARHFRFGEWLGDPVTPLFESWLLTRLEQRLHANYQEISGVPPPDPTHIIVNGWYFYTLNFMPPNAAGMVWLALRHVLPRLLVQPRRVAMMLPFTARFGVELFVGEWRATLLPRYQGLLARHQTTVEHLSPPELFSLVDEVAGAAGDYFTSVTLVAGFAWKAEQPLAAFYRQHLFSSIGGSYQQLLCGLSDPSLIASGHAVQSLDWIHPTLGELDPRKSDASNAGQLDRHARVVALRQAAEAGARAALAGEPKLLVRFEKLLATAQRFAPLREEQVSHFTLGWPLMRRALYRLGGHLREHGTITEEKDIFFLTRGELLAALNAADEPRSLSCTVTRRRQAWQRSRRLAPPLVLGEPLSTMARKSFDEMEATFRPDWRTTANGIHGLPASPGRATGRVRIIHDLEEFDLLEPGNILVIPAATPAWTPLFAYAAAIVADTGSPVAHASLVAREYGIPAVVSTGNATARLRDGQVVIVDGNTGLIEVQP